MPSVPADEGGCCEKRSRQSSDPEKLIHQDEEFKLDPESCGSHWRTFNRGRVGYYPGGEIV